MKRAALAVLGLGIIVASVAVAAQLDASTMAVVVGVVIGSAAAGAAGLAVGYVLGRDSAQPTPPPPVVHNEYHLHQERSLYMQTPPRLVWPPAQPGRAIVRRGDD